MIPKADQTGQRRYGDKPEDKSACAWQVICQWNENCSFRQCTNPRGYSQDGELCWVHDRVVKRINARRALNSQKVK